MLDLGYDFVTKKLDGFSSGMLSAWSKWSYNVTIRNHSGSHECK